MVDRLDEIPGTAADGISSVPAIDPISELSIEAVLEGISEGFFALDPDWRFIAFNSAAEAIFDLSRINVLGRTIWEISPGTVGSEFERRYRSVMTDRVKQTFSMHSIRRPDSYHEVRAFPIARGIGVAMRDISSQERTNRQLREREAELMRVQRIGRVGGLEVDLRNGFQNRRTPEYLILHGLPPDATNESHEAWVARQHPEDRVWVEKHFIDAVNSAATTYSAEYRIIRPSDGELRWIKASAEIERDANGKAVKLVGAHLDITERKLAEIALAESEERFRQIANSAPVPIWVTGANGTREFVNQAFLDFLGVPYDEALQFQWRRRLHVDDYERILDDKRRGEGSQQPFILEGRYRRSDGAWRWLRSESRPRRSPTGMHNGFIGVAYDVTDSKEAERQLTRLNELLEQKIEQRSTQLATTEAVIRTFFQHSSECHAVFVEGRDGLFRYEEINPATLQLYQKTRNEVIGQTIDSVLGPESAAELSAHLVECLSTGLPYRYERMQHGRIIEAVTTPVTPGAGGPRRLVVSARDVTERRRLEDQLRQSQKMEAVGQLTGGIAHDFNNLLTIVMGGLESIGRQVATIEQSHATERIRRSKDMALQGVQRAAILTSRLLAFSRQQALIPQVVDVNKLISGLYELLRRTIGETIELDMALAPDVWTTFADPNQLENAILNLAVNARDAMPEGGKLVIETQNALLDSGYLQDLSEQVAPGQYVMIAVADTGSGMDRATIERAFDPFFTTKEVGKGTGLGLSQVYGFTRQSSGQVKIYSELGEGTTIKIYLPRRTGAQEEVEPVTTGDIVGARGTETILVVEDDDALRTYTTEILRELGYRVTEAANGPAAWQTLQGSDKVDLLLTDIVMAGGVNGRQLADEAVKAFPGIKVLFMTGYSRNAIMHMGRVDPGIQMIGKPFSFQELAAKVRARLDMAD